MEYSSDNATGWAPAPPELIEVKTGDQVRYRPFASETSRTGTIRSVILARGAQRLLYAIVPDTSDTGSGVPDYVGRTAITHVRTPF
jgi:hypothetical protein